MQNACNALHTGNAPSVARRDKIFNSVYLKAEKWWHFVAKSLNANKLLMQLNAFSDGGHSFDALLFYGHELSLTIFDIMVFSFVDLLAKDYLLSAIVTYFAGQVSQLQME